jgi:putative membrane-bound dehydrogenase-like protein
MKQTHALIFAVALAGMASAEVPTMRRVAAPPAELKLDSFYKKHVSVRGFPIVGSDKVSDFALVEAAYLIENVLARRPDILEALAKNKVRFAVMACSERTTDIPEHHDLRPAKYWDRRARGLGATRIRPAVSCGEENLLGFPGDPYRNENILIHEFAHAIHLMALNSIDRDFDRRLRKLYRSAMERGLWNGTYAATNPEEYWAEGVQSWFDCNRPKDRQHNDANTREKLEKYDPDLARLIAEVFRANPWRYTPPDRRKNKAHLTGYDPAKAPTFAWAPELNQWYAAYQAGQKNRGAASPNSNPPRRIKMLFLGDNGHHRPRERAQDILPFLAQAGIDVAYTDDLADLNDQNLARYDGLIIYANHTTIKPEQEAALIQFVEGGRGLVAIHCASYCFLNSPPYIALVGGQFKSHGTGVFQPKLARSDHPALKNVKEFEAWDETYTHQRLSDDREVLMYRAEGAVREPWTWVRRQGRGRVFYTASGHDERVFRKREFQQLIVQGIRWAVGRPDFRYRTEPIQRVPAEVPNYLAGPGGRHHDMPLPLSPRESMRHISIPGGFDVALFAAEPAVIRPVTMTWDDRGRAWIAETVDYPNNLQPEGQGHDRIKICEDTDGDGLADKFTIFADKLSIPTSMVHAQGGLIVAQAPHMLFLQDTDGDGKADVRKVLFTGFFTGDTHAGPSNLRLGLDNWIYATIGYSGFNGVVGGKRHRFRQGLFRFKADGTELEFLGSSTNNTWGLGIGATGEIYYSTANGEHSSYLGLPNRYVEGVRGWFARGTTRMADHYKMHPLTTIRQVDFHGGFTAAAGHAVYTDRLFPHSFWNRIAFVCEPTGHLVHMCLLEPRGSNFVTHDRFNIFASTDEWTSPIFAEIGPDGALWIIDWYNYIVQHNPTPLGYKTGKGNAYITPLRDKTHGRIYRLFDAERGTKKPPNLAEAAPDQLVAALKNDNMFWRLRAQWRLVERKQSDVLPALAAQVADQKLDATKENLPAIHALWAMHGLGAIAGADARWLKAAEDALQHPSAGVRRAALGVLPRTPRSLQAVLRAKLLDDPEPLVRRTALLTLSEMPAGTGAGSAILAMLRAKENVTDHWIPLAATAAAARHDQDFLQASLRDPKAADPMRKITAIVAEHFARGNPGASLKQLLQPLADAQPAMAEAFLDGLAAGWQARAKGPAFDKNDLAGLKKLLRRLSPASQLRLATLASRWGLAGEFRQVLRDLQQRLLADVGNASLEESARIEAARKIALMQPERKVLEKMLGELTIQAGPNLAAGILEAAAQSTGSALGEILVARWPQLTPKLQRKALGILLQRPEWSASLLDGLEKNVIPAADLSADQSQFLAGHPTASIATRARRILARGGSLPSPDRQKVLDSLLPLASRTGDATRGLEVFKKTCAKCHRHGGEGADIGPDLTGFAVHPKAKILTEIIDPNRSVEGNFRQYTVVTTAGKVLNGLLAGETRTAIVLVDGEAKKHTILREDIEQFLASSKSIMPEGFEKQLSPDDFVNLLEFLTAKGKYFPLPLAQAATIASTRGMFYSEDSPIERLVFPDWKPRTFFDVPFQFVDPRGGRVKNVILLHGPLGKFPPMMPKSVKIPCNTAARAIHFLSGVSGWGYPYAPKGSVSLIVRLHYSDGKLEDHPLRNGEHFADYIRRVDVPGSKLAQVFRGGQQLRYLAVAPKREQTIREIELIKGPDDTAPIVMAITVETTRNP